jgi:hypothetical protein
MDRQVKDLLLRQASWQRSRAALPWEEKLRMCLVMREVQRALRGGEGMQNPVFERPSQKSPAREP